ncbi:MurR/RpiR family transcriptional regulator [Jeotgalibaca sp. MA1X17-3]|uniref:MurR/RpiR family transcriptional regulator n=1 Tax=Jeotgalibaca sp. MA1X17-3 TaxID=2908211 RepID=UPI001F1F46E4|nr:MurR/RpiR family transcriptional regulator [Jeotgalibaca sp. MA1X17-3]UJF16321.1 MurR/RpiR family transcriptional regulator [Jeotgalibaca sp. MA1X17-3]
MSTNYMKTLLNPRMKAFSDTEKIIAKHFVKLGIEVANKTLSTLSQDIGFSEATIFKFVKKIGFDGFQSFKISVASNYNQKDDRRHDLTVFSDITKNDSSYVIAQKVVHSSKELLENMIQSLDETLLNKALELIYPARFLHFFGQGASSVIALDGYHKFMRSTFQCNYIMDYHMQLSYATKLGKEDCVFLFSHSGETIETIEIAKILKAHDVKIIFLTGNPSSEIVSLADVSFVVYSEESAFRSETLTSRILYLTIIDILYVNTMYHNEEQNKNSLEHIRDALSITKTGG